MSNNPKSYAEEQILKASKIGPGNLPQGHCTSISSKLWPSKEERAEYEKDLEAERRGDTNKDLWHRLKRYELLYTDKRDSNGDRIEKD